MIRLRCSGVRVSATGRRIMSLKVADRPATIDNVVRGS
jgi:hypothetical protein